MLNPESLSPNFPLAIICTNEKNPPVKSRITLCNDQPTVDCLFQFRYTCGIYFTSVMAALQYPHSLIVPQF